VGARSGAKGTFSLAKPTHTITQFVTRLIESGPVRLLIRRGRAPRRGPPPSSGKFIKSDIGNILPLSRRIFSALTSLHLSAVQFKVYGREGCGGSRHLGVANSRIVLEWPIATPTPKTFRPQHPNALGRQDKPKNTVWLQTARHSARLRIFPEIIRAGGYRPLAILEPVDAADHFGFVLFDAAAQGSARGA